jgi:A/G-specific adenine glycosylase
VGTLANASSDEIMRSWQGLGYYSRARNLHFAAKQVLAEYNGSFPRNYKELIKLKGVGEYTAAAIASFAFKEATPVLDGNVFRFLARHFGLYTPINSPKAKKEFISIALELIDTKNPDLFNQAIMEFGALQCKPQSPNCEACPLNSSCWAFLNNKVNELPLKDKKLTRRSRFFNYFILKNDGSIALNKREEKDIWQELYEFPLIETKKEMSEIEVLELAMESKLLSENMQVLKISEKIKHVLSHQDIFARFFEISDPHFQHQNRDKYLYIKDDEINFFAFPRLIEVYLRK